MTYDGYTAVLSKRKGEGNSWLLTGWQNNKAKTSAYGEGNDSTVATAATTTRTRDSRDAFANNSISTMIDSVKRSDKENEDIRFSMNNKVERVGDLIAIHNLSGDQLLKSIDLGGFPMPSIAVMKQTQGHERYGDVSVIFGKDTIDPKKSTANKVYGGDAWTPTYPTVEYKPRKTVRNAGRRKSITAPQRIHCKAHQRAGSRVWQNAARRIFF